MKKDVFLQSVSAGLLSAIVYAFVELFAIRVGLQHTSVWGAAAGMFLPLNQVATPLGIVIGLIGHMAIGGLWGIGFYILLLYIGIDRSVLKGVLFGFYLWLFSIIMMRWGITSYVFFDANEQLGALLGTLIFGLSLGFFVPRMAMQKVSESNSVFQGLLVKMIAQPVHKPTHNDEEKNKNET